MTALDERPVTADELFTALYREHAGHVRLVAAAQLRSADRDLVEDLTQEVFFRFWGYLVRGNTVANPAALLGTMTRRAAVDYYRRPRNTRESATDFGDPLAARCVPASASAEDLALMHVEIEALLAEASAGTAVA